PAAAAAALAPDGRGLLALTHRPIPGAGSQDPVGTWEADDGPYAELLARTTPGVRWESVVNDARVSPLDAVEWMIGRTWQPPFNPINQVWVNAMVRRTEEQGSPLLLTGSAGNATFSRDSAGIVRGLVRERRLGAVLRQARARHHAGASWPDAVRSVGREGAPERLLAWARARRGIASRQDHPLSTADLPVRRERISAAAVARLDLVEGRIPASRSGWIDFALTDQSRIGTAQNLSPTVWWSDPLSDPEVVELALRLPEEAWIANGWDRGLARAAGVGLVPEAVLWRRTRGAQAADVAAWVAGTEPAYRSLVERFRASASVPEFIDLDALERAIGAGLADPVVAPWWQNVYGRAFALGRFALWYEEEVLRPA
ncbi:asparagine synthase-related protein, partial [Nocardioides stalactiti]|uniref:asparagine synthase-related protein n=1 Tax=Nocardioides stalactiti TaxID=2755356 RepID=UPI001C80DD9C